jgi:putative ABC transport system permease protein
MDTIAQDIRYTLRTMRRNPGFALAVVLTLALGIGVNVTMFSVVDALLFRMPEHVRAPQQIVNVDLVSDTGEPDIAFHSFRGYTRLADNLHLLEIASESHPWAIDFGRGSGAREISASYVTSSYFDVVGVHLLLGRPFTKAEDNPAGGIPVAILGYDFWRALGEDLHILNQAVWIGDRQFTVIGIAPRGFNGLDSSRVDVWLPISDVPSLPGKNLLTSEGSWWLDTIGRLKGGMTRGQGEAEVTAAFVHSGGKLEGKVQLTPYFGGRTQELSQSARVSLWLAGVAFAVLLIACANVVNLFLARIVQRDHEMAIRLQLGASRPRLAGQMLVESLLLSFAGGGAALLVSYWIRPLIGAVLFTKDFYVGNLLNWRVLAISLLLVTLIGLFVGLLAARRAVRQDLAFALKQGSQGKSRERSALRSGLLVTQVALTLVLSIGAGLFIESLRHAYMFDQGFETNRVLFVSMNLGTSGMKPEGINSAYRQLAERANGAPRVERSALAGSVPLVEGTYTSVKDPSSKDSASAGIDRVGPDYFATLGIKILQGRSFLPTDRFGAPPVAIVNETLASDLWHAENPIGKCLVLRNYEKQCHTVVGVVPDQLRSLAAGRTMSRHMFGPSFNNSDAYFPLEQSVTKDLDTPATGLLIRTSGDAPGATHDISEALAGLAPGGRYVAVRPLSEWMDPQIRPFRLGASMFSFFGALALLLAAVGIYGVLAFLVRHRTSEIGIRMALGALPQDVLRLIVWQGMKFVGLGLAIGIVTALGLSRVVRSLLFEVTPTDVWSYAGASGVLLVVSLAACLIPAWRAARVDPSISLRYE